MRNNFRKLQVWQYATSLTEDVYNMSKSFPKEEIYGLTNQIRRSAVSIPSNIAEGCGLDTSNNLIKFLNIAQGSACELETQIEIAYRLKYINKITFDNTIQNLQRIQKMIQRFRDTTILKSKA